MTENSQNVNTTAGDLKAYIENVQNVVKESYLPFIQEVAQKVGYTDPVDLDVTVTISTDKGTGQLKTDINIAPLFPNLKPYDTMSQVQVQIMAEMLQRAINR